MSEGTEGTEGTQGTEGAGSGEKTFTQADIDRITGQARVEARKAAEKALAEKYADYDDLKAKAEGAKTAEDRIAELEKRTSDAQALALRADIANKFEISAEDRDLFLTGTDEATLTAQAERLSERDEAAKQGGNYVGKEGRTPKPTDAKSVAERDFFTQLLGSQP